MKTTTAEQSEATTSNKTVPHSGTPHTSKASVPSNKAKTTLLKNIDRNTQKWYLVDAKDKVVGRLAPLIANKLRGKDKPTFTAHVDSGDFVVVINADKVKLTGSKLLKKLYYTHSGYPGAIKAEKAGDLLNRKPTEILKLAVYGMLPKNKLRKKFMTKLKIYAGETHPHEAQQLISL